MPSQMRSATPGKVSCVGIQSSKRTCSALRCSNQRHSSGFFRTSR
jgi:hypothetical protein